MKPVKPRNLEGISKENIDQHFALYEKYVAQCNKLYLLEKSLANQDSFAAKTLRADLLRQLAFERNGVILHELFFENLQPSPPKSKGEFVKLAKKSFGSLDSWMDDLRNLNSMRGNGWLVSGYDTDMKCLTNTIIDDHSLNVQLNIVPLVVIDLWEHSFIVDFEATGRAEYMEVVLKNLSYEVIETRTRVCM